MNTSRLLYSRREAAQLLSLSLRTVDHLISEHELTIRKVGKRVLVQADSLKEYAGAAGERQTHEKMAASGASSEQISTQVPTAQL
jgi:excisionase family DNA binding protein